MLWCAENTCIIPFTEYKIVCPKLFHLVEGHMLFGNYYDQLFWSKNYYMKYIWTQLGLYDFKIFVAIMTCKWNIKSWSNI